MKRHRLFISKIARARAGLATSAGACLIAVSALAAGPSSSELEGLMSACRTPTLAFDTAVARLAAQGWTEVGSRRQTQELARHVATGLHHREYRDWQDEARRMADRIPSLLTNSSGKNENAAWSTHAAGLIKPGTSSGFLIVTENIVHDAVGDLKTRDRTCWVVLPPSAALDALAATAGKPGPRGAKFRPETRKSDGVTYSLTGLIKSLPPTGLGFVPQATEFLQINMRH